MGEHFALRASPRRHSHRPHSPLTRTNLREGLVQVREDPLVVIEVDDEVGGLRWGVSVDK
jgi:hypothetical protein